KNNLIEYLHYDLDEIFISNLIPYQFEKSFEFNLDNKNEKIQIGGRIDRIDKSIYTNSLSVMDYKTSSSGISTINDIKEGLSFQLPVYILSQNMDNIIQAGYGIIKSSENKYQIALEDESIFAKSSNKLDRESFYELLEITKKNIFEIKRSIDCADFSVKPKECSDYCIYKDICRLVEFRG
ncbi:MAG TPA: PD-(D/E)XK nuclease family protein, partial [Tissierellaceae bacterium]